MDQVQRAPTRLASAPARNVPNELDFTINCKKIPVIFFRKKNGPQFAVIKAFPEKYHFRSGIVSGNLATTIWNIAPFHLLSGTTGGPALTPEQFSTNDIAWNYVMMLESQSIVDVMNNPNFEMGGFVDFVEGMNKAHTSKSGHVTMDFAANNLAAGTVRFTHVAFQKPMIDLTASQWVVDTPGRRTQVDFSKSMYILEVAN